MNAWRGCSGTYTSFPVRLMRSLMPSFSTSNLRVDPSLRYATLAFVSRRIAAACMRSAKEKRKVRGTEEPWEKKAQLREDKA